MANRLILRKKATAFIKYLNNSGKNQTIISFDTGISQVVLSRIMTNKSVSPIKIQNAINRLKKVYSLEFKKEDTEITFDTNLIVIQNAIKYKETIDSKDKFIYYYVDNRYKSNKALLTILSSKEVELTTFFINSHSIRVPYFVYLGQLTYSKETNKTSIYFSRKREYDSTVLINTTPSFCCFEGALSNKSIGVYAAAVRNLSCGIVILEKLEKELIQGDMSKKFVPPEIDLLINESRFISDFYIKNEKSERKKKLLNRLESVSGVYEAFVIVNEVPIAIQKLIIEIHEDGRARYKSIDKPGGEIGKIVDIRRDRNLILQFSRNRAHRYYKVQIILDLIQSHKKNLKDTLIGMYGGIEKTSENPMAGRIILFKTQKRFGDLNFKLFPVNPKNLEESFSNPWRRNTFNKFFKGELDNFGEAPGIYPLLTT